MYILRFKLKKFLPVLRMAPLFIFLNSHHAYTGATASLSGRIISSETQLPLKGANVVIKETDLGAATDDSGYYSIRSIPAGFYTIQVSHIGYQSHVEENVQLSEGANKRIDFELIPTIVKLKSVEVEAERLWDKYVTDVSLVGVQRMKPDQIVTIPGAFDDPARAVQIMSGVSGGGDFSSFLAVRGGSPDQNLVVMDGVVIPNPYRFRLAMGGGLSIFDPNIIGDVHLHLGGYSAEFGNRLSSVLDVETRTGSRDDFNFQGSINLTDAGAVVEFPFLNNKGSLLISGRRTYFDFIVDEFSQSNSTYPFCYDLNGKLVFDINTSHRLTFRGMLNRESTKLISEIAENVDLTENAKTILAAISWDYFFTKKLNLNTVVSAYRDLMNYHSYKVDTAIVQYDYEKQQMKITDISFRMKMNYRLNRQTNLTAGLQYSYIHPESYFYSQPRNFYYARNEFPGLIDFSKLERYGSVFLEATQKLNEQLELRCGIREDYSDIIGDYETSPRLSFLYKINSTYKIDGSWGVIYQFPSPESIFFRDQPLNFQYNLKNIDAEKATHNVLSITRKFSPVIEAKMTLYYKDIDRLLLPSDNEIYVPYNDGRGISRGIEFIIQKKQSPRSRINGLISYSLSNSYYYSIDNHKKAPFNYDRRHSLSFWTNIKITKNISFVTLYQMASGLPYTPVTNAVIYVSQDAEEDWDFVRGARNSGRLPAYHRLDARLSYRYRFGDNFMSFYLDFINLTNHENIYNMTWEKLEPTEEGDEAALKRAKKRIVYMLPFLPSLGFSFRF